MIILILLLVGDLLIGDFMVMRNKNMIKLNTNYLFPEIKKRKQEYLNKNPNAKLISLGVGDTTQPITKHIAKGLLDKVKLLTKKDTYTGYGDEQGLFDLRKKIAEKLYNNVVGPNEIFISDGAKCDIGRLQLLFGNNVTVAVQDPSYPVYVDGSVIVGTTGKLNQIKNQFDKIQYMQCVPENNFFPNLSKLKNVDIIYFCSPNNPTGAVATKSQLKELVDFAKSNNAIIIFDSAYSFFIKYGNLPKSIYEIAGAKEVAIEINSFSKPLGFTGVRLGWTIVPNELRYDDGTQVNKDWTRIITTLFNGASNISQQGGLYALDDLGLLEMQKTIGYYLQNTLLIKNTLELKGIKTYGGINAPYVWAYFPNHTSWNMFDIFLTQLNIITTPGVGFGPAGEHFVRLSGFGNNSDILEAIKRIKKHNF